jgi:PKD repeat protein
MKKFVLILFVNLSIPLVAQDSLSVLFIGNSYTFANDLPSVFTSLTTSLGDIATVDSKTNGGFTFQNHLDDPATHVKIESKKWDYVVLQGQSQEPSFPTGQVNQATLPPAVSLADSVYANWFCSQAVYFMTWGRQNGDPQWDSINTFDKMNVRLRNAYARIADSANASVSPVGIAWKYVRDTYPAINLYSGDGSHPSVEGTYLAACTFYASLFRKSPVGATYFAGLDPTVAGQLQGAAEIAVLDSLDTWNLQSTESLTVADFSFQISGNTVSFENSSSYATDFTWYFGDEISSIESNPVHSFQYNGTFNVELIASSECGTDTLMVPVTIQYWGIGETDHHILLKTMDDGTHILESSEGFFGEIILMDAQGRQLSSNTLTGQKTFVLPYDSSVSGIYFVLTPTGTYRVLKMNSQEK